MAIRRRQGINAVSVVHIAEAREGVYAALIGTLEHGDFAPRTAVKIGSGNWSPGHEWNLATFGNRYAIWTR